MKTTTIDTLLIEKRTFNPSTRFKKQANGKKSEYANARRDYVKFWERLASELVWNKKWHTGLTWKAPDAKWFVGGRLNITESCLDRHIKDGRKNKAALIWEGEIGDRRTLTYFDLYRQVNKFANVLKKMGIRKGDRVAIYLPMIPELVVSTLACARIGAIHSVVFGGFSPESLRDRILDLEAKMLITADGGYRRGQIIPLKHDADVALNECPSIENVIVMKRGNFLLRFKDGRDHWYHRLMQEADPFCAPVYVNSEHPLFILYTSGTTGKPKGILHTTGGYMTGVYATTKYVFDLKEDDVFWCTADIGWITGHSYLVYGPTANGATQVMYEGAPDWPDRDRFWQIVEDYGVSVFYTAPTAIRAFMKWGKKWPEKHDLSSLRLLGTVGEPINPEAWMWYHRNIGKENCPIVDTWWQTETGHIMITPLPGVTPTKPGSATHAFPGIEAKLFDEQGRPIKEGGGYLAITQPWPGMLRGIWRDRKRFVNVYWSKWNGTYFPGDGAKLDKDKYFWILGRVDDVINTAGHRISTMEVESALVAHDDVVEAAVVGIPHDLKGECLVAFVTLGSGLEFTDQISKRLIDFVANKIGAIARPERIINAPELPKTRSGKIMRRLLRDIARGKLLGDTTTLADPEVLTHIKSKYEED
ncbi:MAG: acetate--CoA ligase [Aliifodinibius sp.]|nr:acetate--CoA ligase [candidate division Zixibacteria bacterium]NIT57208.1 acetate--CoA ligase [Fodinibius sp.]NIW40164.1 acetate--CoA ligase [candidate division Zixibacteria bacterium]NIX56283.1 acetate--CoA ligase [candidate division Zixibacteria bacterium]NIY25790.1 acetate--CoA ligase [Fodinibius sp.]